MSIWNKKNFTKNEIERLEKKYRVDALVASILVRRGITEGRDILYYMEDDLRFCHSGFSFSAMEDAVDRILDAQEEREKVLIFGDRDVDGVSSTTVLYECLKDMGLDVQYRLPFGDDAYGLSMAVIDDFSKESGTLIITVDCGITNIAEVAHAAELGIDVIITDHHEPQEELPSPSIILNPKCADSGYPFREISGCAVAFKLVSALRFSRTRWYKQDVSLLNVVRTADGFTVECIKLRNLVPQSRLREPIPLSGKPFEQTRLPAYLEGQIILIWDENYIRGMLNQCFGTSADFNLIDLRPILSKQLPSFAALPLSHIKNMSKIARYGGHEPTETGSFYNLYVTYVHIMLKKTLPNLARQEEQDLQLVGLAALADIMPMKDENRIFVKQAMASINANRARPGLLELMAGLDLLGKRINSIDIGWTLVSNLNAAGRTGHPELAVDLFLKPDVSEREAAAQKIKECNAERKQLTVDAFQYAAIQAKASVPLYHNKLCVVIDERINRGITGLLAGRLANAYDVPALAVTFVGNMAVGSIRSARNVDVSALLNSMGDIFTAHGGHTFAGGFSFERNKLETFESKLSALSETIVLEESHSDIYDIDAEIPEKYLTPELLKVCDLFEPFGNENEELTFMSKNLEVVDARLIGRTEKVNLKITFAAGQYKWPALFWGAKDRWHRDFEIGDRVDILYHVQRNTYNGIEMPQLILVDLRKTIA